MYTYMDINTHADTQILTQTHKHPCRHKNTQNTLL